MAIQSWQNIIDAIRNGEAVTAEVTNRAIYQLAQRTEHLKTRQDAQDYAQALFIADAPLRSDVATGHAVYFDITAGVVSRSKIWLPDFESLQPELTPKEAPQHCCNVHVLV